MENTLTGFMILFGLVILGIIFLVLLNSGHEKVQASIPTDNRKSAVKGCGVAMLVLGILVLFMIFLGPILLTPLPY